ncbi:uncharacterized protein LOC116350880 [Contarinia nasturtii]|uniref:uncharacterized protein LOC116350880 n=1 Tax=Contarinia nasturtii TaxID=265458 RepID=UPI0012D3CF7A|nr:uncharacterized protein LOC116350880 [Contarinia nasturtii]
MQLNKIILKIWLICAVILLCITMVRSIPTGLTKSTGIDPKDDTLSDIQPEASDDSSNKKKLEDENQRCNLNVSSLEDYSNGQELINLLMEKGEIEPKPSSQFQKIRRDKYCADDRYDELISAFNVILEEVLHKGRFDPKNDEKTVNRIENDSREMSYLKQTHSALKLSKCGKRQKCLSEKEDELLQNINMLNNQLNVLMGNSANEASKRKRRTHGIRSPPSVSHSDNKSTVLPTNHIDGRTKPQNIAPTIQYVTQSSVFEESMSEQKLTTDESLVNDGHMTVSSIGKLQTIS